MAVGILPTNPDTSTAIIVCKQRDPGSFFAKTPRQASPLISDRLERVIMKAVAPRREDRYQDCRAFRNDLDFFRSAGTAA
jgi:hypothetical protein